ncbi:hypothetical protein L3Q82_006390 [Scortum barcoo]|uniref:Uncharacterized protein n=1 Tax=Scortum barcoo TaxID=214431 RepID=A0ACB8WZR7_9TELE|nr:hypothetical protein L3Q82_006390 [Scortum barcoo]
MEVCTTSRKLTLLSFTFLWGLSGIWAQIQMPQSSMEVIKGQTVVLKASYSTQPGKDLSVNTILWNFVSNQTQLIISYTKDSISFGPSQFKGRVGFVTTMPSSEVSLYINNTQESDSGRYLCQIIIPDNPGLTAELSLDVKVPPAPPTCSLSGKPVLKGNVTLMCKSSAGKPIPLYKWTKTSPTSEVFFSPMLNEKTGVLRLSNLSSNMSGKYMCTARNSAGSENCSINLDIVSSTNVGMIVGATVGSVVGFIFLLLLCLVFLVKRRRDNEDDLANEIKLQSTPQRALLPPQQPPPPAALPPAPPLRHRLHHHRHGQHGTATGYRPSRHHGATTPTHYSYNNNSTLQRGQPVFSEGSTNGSSLPRPERYTQLPQAQALPQTYSQPQPQRQAAPSPPPLPTSTVTASNIVRMGGVPIMVPAQNQAGSLV